MLCRRPAGIANRRHFAALFQREAERCRRYRRPVTLAFMDLDDFKAVNDTHGHAAGDEVLQTVADVLRRHLRATDIVARIGGDEFVMALPETDAEAAEGTLARLREELLRAMRARDWPVTFSIGAVTYADAPSACEEAIRRADDCMYQAKREGKNRILHRVVEAA